MVVNQPHFLLFCDTNLSSTTCAVGDQGFGRWHFVLERLDGPERLEVADSEASVHRDRLALLAVVRGLEALEQPSHVTLVTTSRYVSRGLRYGLNEWREAEYTWEHFGSQRPIRNADLWQRVDRALAFHQITCRLLQSQLAQAVVETAAELDELSVMARPLPLTEAAAQVAAQVAMQTAAAACEATTANHLAARNGLLANQAAATVGEAKSAKARSRGKIQRHDAAHCQPTEIPTHDIQPQEIQLPVASSSRSLRSSGEEPAMVTPRRQLILPYRRNKTSNDVPLASATTPTLWRPKIRISIPVFHFHQRWWQLAMAWIRWLRSRTQRNPTMAPT